MRRSTGIRIEAGAAGRHARAMAEQAAAAMEAASTGKIPTVREYLTNYPRKRGESSEMNQRRAFNLFLEYLGAGADRRIDTITPAICRGFVQHELRRVARGTVELYRGYVWSAFRCAVEVDDYMNKNPMAAVSLADEARAVIPERGQDVQKRQPFTLEEIHFMIQSFPAPWNDMMAAEARAMMPERGLDKQKRLPFTLEEIHFMIQSFPAPWCDMVAVSFYLGGLRLSDVCMLRWDSVNWRESYVRLVEVKTRKERYLPILPQLKEVLVQRLTQSTVGEEYVFPDMAHYYLGSSKTSISTQFTALLRAHGILRGR